jgi:hypothetical protein
MGDYGFWACAKEAHPGMTVVMLAFDSAAKTLRGDVW